VYNTHVTSRQIIKRLKKDGWYQVRSKGGSHKQFKHNEKPGRVTVPHPERDFPVGTLKSIFEQAGWNWRER